MLDMWTDCDRTLEKCDNGGQVLNGRVQLNVDHTVASQSTVECDGRIIVGDCLHCGHHRSAAIVGVALKPPRVRVKA